MGGLAKHKITGVYKNEIKYKPSEVNMDISDDSLAKVREFARVPIEAEVMAAFAGLRLHCVSKNLDMNESRAFLKDYWIEFQHTPLSVIKWGVDIWKRKNESPLYFPTIGQFRAAIFHRAKDMENVLKRAEMLSGGRDG